MANTGLRLLAPIAEGSLTIESANGTTTGGNLFGSTAAGTPANFAGYWSFTNAPSGPGIVTTTGQTLGSLAVWNSSTQPQLAPLTGALVIPSTVSTTGVILRDTVTSTPTTLSSANGVLTYGTAQFLFASTNSPVTQTPTVTSVPLTQVSNATSAGSVTPTMSLAITPMTASLCEFSSTLTITAPAQLYVDGYRISVTFASPVAWFVPTGATIAGTVTNTTSTAVVIGTAVGNVTGTTLTVIMALNTATPSTNTLAVTFTKCIINNTTA